MSPLARTTFSAALALLLLWLAQHTWWLSAQPKLLQDSPLSANQPSLEEPLMIELADVDRQLDYMVWARQRNALLNQKLNLIQQLINKYPLDYTLWILLLRLQEEVALPHAERVWALTQALKLAGWHHSTHWDLIYFCMTLKPEQGGVGEQECNALMRSTPLESRMTWVARVLRLDEDELRQRFSMAKSKQL